MSYSVFGYSSPRSSSNLRGPKGPKGDKGDSVQGPAGLPGPIGPAGKDSPRGFLMVSLRQALTIEDLSFNIPLAKTSISIGENAQLTESAEIEILKSGEYAISFIIGHQVLLQNIHCVAEYVVTTRSPPVNPNEIPQPVSRVSTKVSAHSTSGDCYFQACQAEHILKLDSGTALQIVGKYQGPLSAVAIESAFVTVKAI